MAMPICESVVLNSGDMPGPILLEGVASDCVIRTERVC